MVQLFKNAARSSENFNTLNSTVKTAFKSCINLHKKLFDTSKKMIFKALKIVDKVLEGFGQKKFKYLERIKNTSEILFEMLPAKTQKKVLGKIKIENRLKINKIQETYVRKPIKYQSYFQNKVQV